MNADEHRFFLLFISPNVKDSLELKPQMNADERRYFFLFVSPSLMCFLDYECRSDPGFSPGIETTDERG